LGHNYLVKKIKKALKKRIFRRRDDAFHFRWVRVKYKSVFKKFKQTISRPKKNPLGFLCGEENAGSWP